MVSKVRADASFGDNIYLMAQQIFQILPEAYQVQRLLSGFISAKRSRSLSGSLFTSGY